MKMSNKKSLENKCLRANRRGYRKRVLALILSVIMTICLVPVMGKTTEVQASDTITGSGTQDDPYVLYKAEHLKWLSDRVHYNYTEENNGFEGKYIRLGSDIDISGYSNWTPIGFPLEESANVVDTHSEFRGNFDGYGYKITGLTVNNPTKNELGLFGIIGNTGSVRNLTVENATINGNEKVGIVAGNCYGIIENCTVSGTVTGKKYTGGIVGYLPFTSMSQYYMVAGYSKVNELSNCLSKAVINGGEQTGGIAGYSRRIIQSCTNDGSVTGTGIYTGGIVGYNEGVVNNCVNSENGSLSGIEYIGGITGSNQFEITDCTNSAEVSSNKSLKGGISGLSAGIIRGCLNTGKISGNAAEKVGGITGFLDGGNSSLVSSMLTQIDYYIMSCTNWGEISTGGNNNGGIAGYVSNADLSGCNVSISDCVNTGDVSNGVNKQNRGGIVGYAQDVNIISCTNWGHIEASKDLGGIVGECLNCITIDNCLNKGEVEQKETGKYINGCGGIIGNYGGNHWTYSTIIKETFTVSNCTNAGKITVMSDCGAIGGIIGKTSFPKENAGFKVLITKCSNLSDIFNGYTQIGGIVGEIKRIDSDILIELCLNNGEIRTYDAFAGGICGYSEGSLTIRECRNDKDIRFVESDYYEYVPFGLFLGGILGYGDKTTIKHSVNYGNIYGKNYSGGICGYSTNGYIDRCFNLGYIEATGTKSYLKQEVTIDDNEIVIPYIPWFCSYAGGIAGYVYDDSITRCGNKGKVVSSGNMAGGIVGKLDGHDGDVGLINYKYDENGLRVEDPDKREYSPNFGGGLVKICYNRGEIVGNDYVGGLIGQMNFWSQVLSCYNYSEAPKALNGENVGKLIGDYTPKNIYLDQKWSVYKMDVTWIRKCIYTNGMYDPVGWDKTNTKIYCPLGANMGFYMCSDYHYFTNSAMRKQSSLREYLPFYYGEISVDNPMAQYVIGDDDAPTIYKEDLVWNLRLSNTATGGLGGCGGNGSLGNTIRNIDSAEAFKTFASEVNNGKTFDGFTIILQNDIDLGSDWTPIGIFDISNEAFYSDGVKGKPFMGVFDGQGHTVSVTVNSSEVASGLFGYIYHNNNDNGIIRNLQVVGTVKGSGKYVGGIVGVNHGVVKNCSFIGNVESTNTDENAATGGIVGLNGYEWLCYTQDCCHYGKVTANGGDVGGIAGRNFSTGACFSVLKFNFHGNGDVSGGKYAGGIVGRIDGLDKNVLYNICSDDYEPGRVLGNSGDWGTNHVVKEEDCLEESIYDERWDMSYERGHRWGFGEKYPCLQTFNTPVILKRMLYPNESRIVWISKYDPKVSSEIFTGVKGVIFDVWSTEPDGIGTNYQTGERINNIEKTDILYAQWKFSSLPLQVSGIVDAEYTGEAITQPGIVVKAGDDVLEKDVDYKVSYTNNIKPGNATVTVEGLGAFEYSSPAQENFTIEKIDPLIKKPEGRYLKYNNGEEQELLFAGDTAGESVMLYALTQDRDIEPEDDAYSEEIPKAKKMGTYHIYYKIKGDSIYKDVAPQYIQAGIYLNEDHDIYVDDICVNVGETVTIDPIDLYGDFSIYTIWDGTENIAYPKNEFADIDMFNNYTVTGVKEGSFSVRIDANIPDGYRGYKKHLINITVTPKETRNDFRFENRKVTKTYADEDFTIVPISESGYDPSEVTYTSSDPDVATVDSATGQISINKVGHSLIRATLAETETHAKAVTSYLLIVDYSQITISAVDQNLFVYDKEYDLEELEEGKQYTVTGLKKGEKLNGTIKMSYEKDDEEIVPNTMIPGSYDIVISGGVSPINNSEGLRSYYNNVIRKNGKLTVSDYPTYAVTVVNGEGSNDYKEGEMVCISADEKENQEFVNWTSDDEITFNDAEAAETYFTMPAKAVTVTANYKTKSGETNSGSGENTSGSGEQTSGSGEKTSGSGENTSGSGETTSGSGENTSGSGEQTSGSGETTSGSGENTSGSGEQTSGSGENTSGSGENTSGSGENTSGSGEQTSGSGENTSGSGEKTSGSGDQTSGSGENTSGSGENTSGSGENTSGSGEQTSGSGENTSGSGENTSGSGEQTSGSGENTSGSDENTSNTENNNSGNGENTSNRPANEASVVTDTSAVTEPEKTKGDNRKDDDKKDNDKNLSPTAVVINNDDGSITERDETVNSKGTVKVIEKTEKPDGTVIISKEVTYKNGSGTFKQETKGGDGTSSTVTSTRSANGNEKTTTRSQDTEGNVTIINETKKYNEKTGITTDKKVTYNPDKTKETTVRKTQENGDYTETCTVVDENGTKIETHTTKRVTDEKTGTVIETIKIKKDNTTYSNTVKTVYSDGSVSKITLTETGFDGSKTKAEFGIDQESGNCIISSFTTSSETVTIPDVMVDADGVEHPIISIPAGLFSKNVTSIVLSENIEIIAKKAFGGLKNLTSIVCYPGTKFEKNSLNGTSEELTIMLTFPKDSTKKERRAAKKALMKQLKKAGNKNAKIVVVISE